jgi:hypothetical protein
MGAAIAGKAKSLIKGALLAIGLNLRRIRIDNKKASGLFRAFQNYVIFII